MKKLYSALDGFMGHIAGQSVTGGISYVLAETTDPEVRLYTNTKRIQSLDFEFPDLATNRRYREIFNDCQDAKQAAEIYLAELGLSAELEIKPEVKPKGKPEVKRVIVKKED